MLPTRRRAIGFLNTPKRNFIGGPNIRFIGLILDSGRDSGTLDVATGIA